ncbi:torsin-1A-interacting protein 1-like isoform X2 [Kryptolebias marmoratus]|uniref:torsin-1A-interacting protein 1-like isoform X2 n=1 Tax=Kryptolebias marmoratus TaxID=37003 RepID=UPI0007F8D35B|nr:torsin-1A-interacting protein 1-like isoform X2 [Kryptolebias marmoratus]
MSKSKTSVPLRRSTRQSGKALIVEPTPRGPLKRTKRPSEDQPSAAVKGVKHVENGWEDEDSPKKKHRFDNGDGDSVGENEMDVEESAKEVEKNENQEMDIEEDSSNETSQPKICKAGTIKEVNLSPRVVLGQRCQTSHSLNEDLKGIKPKQAALKQPASPTKCTPQVKPPVKTDKIHNVPIISMDEYRRKMEAKARSTGLLKANHFVQSVRPPSEKTCTMRQRVNSIPAPKETLHLTKQEASKKTAGTKNNSGFVWWVIFLLLLSSSTLLAYKFLPVLQRTAGVGRHRSTEVKLETFSDRLSLLKAQFPSQRPDLWKRSRIHLEKHLKTAHPTEPVSLMFAAGLGAKRTLDCLARSTASVYSSALNASVLHLDGVSKSGQDSDKVKLDIDNQLRAAFGGDKPVAVIHRFEELPPGSTLIFYRYCDHENAAYKQVFLLFTVLLPQEEIGGELSLEKVEELVHDYVEGKQVGSTSNSAYNEMDIDKFSGLWSRISHLILPVVPEEQIERDGCAEN